MVARRYVGLDGRRPERYPENPLIPNTPMKNPRSDEPAALEVDYLRPQVLGRLQRKPVGAVVNALRILEQLRAVHYPMRVTHLALDLGINQSTCFNILNTLVQEGYVEFTPKLKGYSIGSKVITLARGALDPKGAIASVQPEMRRIAQMHNMIVTIWKRSGIDRMTLIACAESDAAVRLHLTVGHSVPLLLGATGRVMAMRGGLDELELRRQFNGVRWSGAMSFADFMKEVEAATTTGYAVDNCVANAGLLTIATPILLPGRNADAVCCGSLFAGDYPERLIHTIALELARISAAIGKCIY